MLLLNRRFSTFKLRHNLTGGPPLDEDLWHVTEYYEKIRKKVKNLDPTLGKCNDIGSMIPARMCKTPMKVRL